MIVNYRHLFISSILFFLFFPLLSLAQKNRSSFRRCYIVSYEAFDRFDQLQKYSGLQEGIISLFENKIPTALRKETPFFKSDVIDFFNPETDIVFFYNFGTRSTALGHNGKYRDQADTEVLDNYLTSFIRRDTNYLSANSSIGLFFEQAFSNVPKHDYKLDGMAYQSQSSYVFPLIVSCFPPNITANEYYLLIASKFNTAQNTGNMGDKNQIKAVLREKTTVIEKVIELLKSRVYDIPVLEFIFTEQDNNYVGIRGSRIMPVIGKDMSDVSLMIDSDIKFTQNKYGENSYTQDSVTIFFTQNETLALDSLILNVSAQNKTLFQRNIPINEINFINSRYRIPQQNITLDQDPSEIQNLNDVQIKYTFYSKFQVLDSTYRIVNLGFTFPTGKSISGSSFVFQSSASALRIKIFLTLLPYFILLFLAILIVMIWGGRVKRFIFEVDGFTDNLKEIKNCRITHRNYFSWKDEYPASYVVSVTPVYYLKYFSLKWKYSLPTEIIIETVDGSEKFENCVFNACIRNVDGANRTSLQSPFTPRIFNDNMKYVIEISKKAGCSIDFDHRHIFKVSTNCQLEQSLWYIFRQKKAINNAYTPYEFEIGENLGSMWVGLDPGTTGSTLAFGNDPRNIFLSKAIDAYGKLHEINNSILQFDNENSLKSIDIENWIPGIDYNYGFNAWNKRGLKGTTTFRSMKKLLGYETYHRVAVDQTQKMVEGNKLFALLVKGLYQDLKSFIDKDSENEGLDGYLTTNQRIELFNKEQFDPKRAVVAIPNNFTLRKIQDMVDSIGSLKQFKEVIYTYEAEAVLYYCIKSATIKSSSIVLVFDMGGATINASLFDLTIKKDRDNPLAVSGYKIDTLGRIGYGIGGDTIDFCIIETVLSLPTVIDALDLFNEDASATIKKEALKKYRNKFAERLLEMAFNIKMEIISNFGEKKDYLISEGLLSEYISTGINVRNYRITEDSVDYSLFKESFPLLLKGQIYDNVYCNVSDAINELLQFDSINSIISNEVTVVFSGRTTAFPFIKKYVSDALGKRLKRLKIMDLTIGSEVPIEKLKTIVAEGACWYGLMRNKIEATNNKCFYSFVIKKSISGTNEGVQFVNMIERGQVFDEDNNTMIRNQIVVDSDFSNDSYSANIYQVTGSNALDVYGKDEFKHKISKVTELGAHNKINSLAIEIKTDDTITCIARYTNGSEERESGNVETSDMANENAEHYRFAAMLNSNPE